MFRVRLSYALPLALVAMLGACGKSASPKATGSSSPPTGTTAPGSLTVTEHEFAISLSAASVAAGALAVTAHNTGTIPHEMVAFRTDLAETALPQVADGSKVDEEGAGITHVDPEAEDVMPGTDKVANLTLTPGRYVFICNLPGHYKSGMHAVLTVT
jgi:uncharacterized cupredoxin-like copper-binding protein